MSMVLSSAGGNTKTDETDTNDPKNVKRDMYGRKVATADQFDILKNAPKMESVGKVKMITY